MCVCDYHTPGKYFKYKTSQLLLHNVTASTCATAHFNRYCAIKRFYYVAQYRDLSCFIWGTGLQRHRLPQPHPQDPHPGQAGGGGRDAGELLRPAHLHAVPQPADHRQVEGALKAAAQWARADFYDKYNIELLLLLETVSLVSLSGN